MTGPIAGVVPSQRPATRLARLGAAFVDAAFAALPLMLVAFGLVSAGILKLAGDLALQSHNAQVLIVALVSFGLVTLAQSVLFVASGQSFGKLGFRVRIVKLDGSRVGAGELFKRLWLPGLAWSLVPVFPILDGLFVLFRSDGRALHDLWAGTKVVQA